MIITRHEIGTGKRRSRVYAISTTPQENGSDRPQKVERFPSLESAALVLRYMTGGEMDATERTRAQEALAHANKKGAADSLATTANP